MTGSFLHQVLNEGHLRDLGEDQTRFEYLRRAVSALETFLLSENGRAEVIPFTIAGLDPETPPADPVFSRVTEAIVREWPTYRNVFPADPPCRLLRMVGLAALDAASASDDDVAAAAWYTASNWLRVGTGVEDVVKGLITRLGSQTEQRAVELWKRPPRETSFRMPSRRLAEMEPIRRFSLKKDSVQDAVAEAVKEGISNLKLQSRSGQTNPQAWVEAMAPKLAAVIRATAIEAGNAVVDGVNEAGLVSAKGMKEFAAAIGDKVREALVEAERAEGGRDLRIHLLWWRQSLYSPSQRGSYRDLEAGSAVLIMAVDLHVLVPNLTPQSIEFLLRETVRACGFDTQIGLADLQGIARRHRGFWSESYRGTASHPPRRAPLLTAALAENGDVEDWLGPASSASLPAPDTAVWLFRELQASRLVSAVPDS